MPPYSLPRNPALGIPDSQVRINLFTLNYDSNRYGRVSLDRFFVGALHKELTLSPNGGSRSRQLFFSRDNRQLQLTLYRSVAIDGPDYLSMISNLIVSTPTRN